MEFSGWVVIVRSMIRERGTFVNWFNYQLLTHQRQAVPFFPLFITNPSSFRSMNLQPMSLISKIKSSVKASHSLAICNTFFEICDLLHGPNSVIE